MLSFEQKMVMFKRFKHDFFKILFYSEPWLQKYRTQTEGVTFLHESEENSPFFTIPGLDYVAHDDVMPYSTLSVRPIQHSLLDKFISYEPTTGVCVCCYFPPT